MTPTEYESALSDIARELRMYVAPELLKDESNYWLAESVNNAADLLQHQLIVTRMMRSILQDLGASDPKADRLLKALDKVIAAADPPQFKELEATGDQAAEGKAKASETA